MRTTLGINFLCIFFMCQHSFAQNYVSGTVTDSIANPIAFANVLVTTKTDSTIIAYGYTNDQGVYKIEVDSLGSYLLNISGLSYKTVEKPIQITKPNQQLITNIVMQDQAEALDEVIINTDAPITVKKDTIIFKVKHFTDGREEVAEDVLSKLPGVEVDADGTISVQGKSIQKVMVEGDDLFDRGYSLLTKNLNAGVIDKVEVLQHFSDNPLLKGVEDSDKVALNITLKKDQKTSLFGNASLGYGTEQFYENRLNLISFNKKTKYYFFGNLNNTGVDPTGDIYKVINPGNVSGVNYIGDGVSLYQKIQLDGGYIPNLREERVNFNNAEFASLNGIYNPTDKLKLKGLTFFNTDEQDFFNKNTTQFIVGNDRFTNIEDKKSRKKSRTIYGKWDGIYTINSNTRVEYVGKYTNANTKSAGQSFFNSLPINQQLETETQFTDHRITYTQRVKDKNALLFTARYKYDQKPEVFVIDRVIFEELFPEIGPVDRVTQNISQRLNFGGLEGNYITKHKKNNLDIKLGYSVSDNQLVSFLSFDDDTNSNRITNQGFDNDMGYLLQDIYSTIKYKWVLGAIAIRATLDIHQIIADIDQNTQKTRFSNLYTIPKIGLRWNINKKNKLSVLYNYNINNYSPLDVQQGYLLTSYRNFSRGIGTFGQLMGNYFLASYELGNWTDEFVMNTSFIYQNDDDYFGNRSEITSNYNLSEKFLLKNKNYYAVNMSMDKYIDPFSNNIKLKGSFSEINLQNIVNGSNLRDINTQSIDYGVEMRSVFSGFFNYHIGTKWITSAVMTSNKRSNTNNDAFLDLNFDFSEKFKITVKNERYYFGNVDRDNTYYFSDIEANYTIKKNGLKLKFIAKNIWNTDTFATTFIGDTSQFVSESRLLPRYFLVKLDFRF